MTVETISAAELFGVNEALNHNIGKDALFCGEREYSRTVEELSVDEDIFADGVIDRLAQRRGQRAQDRYKEEVELGHHNTLRHRNEGFIALLSSYVTPSREDQIVRIFEVDEPELGYPELARVDHPTRPDGFLLGLKFQAGQIITRHGPGILSEMEGMDIWHPSEQFRSSVKDNLMTWYEMLCLETVEIARVESTSGLLWQNTKFTPEGARRQQQPVDILTTR